MSWVAFLYVLQRGGTHHLEINFSCSRWLTLTLDGYEGTEEEPCFHLHTFKLTPVCDDTLWVVFLICCWHEKFDYVSNNQ